MLGRGHTLGQRPSDTRRSAGGPCAGRADFGGRTRAFDVRVACALREGGRRARAQAPRISFPAGRMAATRSRSRRCRPGGERGGGRARGRALPATIECGARERERAGACARRHAVLDLLFRMRHCDRWKHTRCARYLLWVGLDEIGISLPALKVGRRSLSALSIRAPSGVVPAGRPACA